MPEPKVSLAEMADACRGQADHIRGVLAHYATFYPTAPPDNIRFQQARAFESAANVLGIMAASEDRSRKFVAQLIADHGRG